MVLFKVDNFGSTINISPWILVPAAKSFRTPSIPIFGYSVFSPTLENLITPQRLEMAAHVCENLNVESSVSINNLLSNKYAVSMFDLTK